MLNEIVRLKIAGKEPLLVLDAGFSVQELEAGLSHFNLKDA